MALYDKKRDLKPSEVKSKVFSAKVLQDSNVNDLDYEDSKTAFRKLKNAKDLLKEQKKEINKMLDAVETQLLDHMESHGETSISGEGWTLYTRESFRLNISSEERRKFLEWLEEHLPEERYEQVKDIYYGTAKKLYKEFMEEKHIEPPFGEAEYVEQVVLRGE